MLRKRQALASVYFEDESGRRTASKLLTRDDRRPGRVFSQVPKAEGDMVTVI